MVIGVEQYVINHREQLPQRILVLITNKFNSKNVRVITYVRIALMYNKGEMDSQL